jgi:hypothetical protein
LCIVLSLGSCGESLPTLLHTGTVVSVQPHEICLKEAASSATRCYKTDANSRVAPVDPCNVVSIRAKGATIVELKMVTPHPCK